MLLCRIANSSEKHCVKLYRRFHQFNSKLLLAHQSGQGTVEYLLTIAVTMIIVLGLLWQFSTAFRNYAGQIFDSFVTCPLELGELPWATAECTPPKFDLASGKMLPNGSIGSGSGGAGGGANGANGGANGANGAGGSSGGSKNGSSSGNQSAGKSAKNGSGSRRETVATSGGGGRVFSMPIGSVKAGRESSKVVGKVKETNAGHSELVALDSSAYDPGGYGKRKKRTALDGSFSLFGDQKSQDDSATVSAVAEKKDDGSGLKPKRSKLELARGPANTKTSDESGFSFGYLIRILLIVGLLIAIIVFFGGQLLQISKSSEK